MPVTIDVRPVFGPVSREESPNDKNALTISSPANDKGDYLRKLVAKVQRPQRLYASVLGRPRTCCRKSSRQEKRASLHNDQTFEKCFVYIVKFKTEAEDLGCEEGPPQVQAAASYFNGEAPPDDPFRDVAMFRATLDAFIAEAELAKIGQGLERWPVWQILPLATRTKLNDLIEMVAKEREQYRWNIDKEYQQEMMELGYQAGSAMSGR